jgi:hypothetical protein
MEELEDADAVLKALPRLCPGFKAGSDLSAADACRQFYAELMFLKALGEL